MTAAELISALHALRRVETDRPASTPPSEPSWGLRMRELFDVAKAHSAMTLTEVDKLFDHPSYEVRLAAVSVLDFKSRKARTVDERRALYETYMNRHDRIDNWGMVDRAAPWVVGGHLAGRSHRPLLTLTKSTAPLKRRTAITAPLFFVGRGNDTDVAHGFEIAERLVDDPIDVVHNAVGIFLKHAGRRDPEAQQLFLAAHAATMPRAGLRLAIATLTPERRARFLNARPK